jgi:hypothetical protein
VFWSSSDSASEPGGDIDSALVGSGDICGPPRVGPEPEPDPRDRESPRLCGLIGNNSIVIGYLRDC